MTSSKDAVVRTSSIRKLPTILPGPLNPLRPNSDLSQTSHWNIKGSSVSEVMRIEIMITQVKVR